MAAGGLKIHPEVMRLHSAAATPPSPRRHKPQRYGLPLTCALLLFATGALYACGGWR